MFNPVKTPFKDAFLEASVFTNTASGQTFSLGGDQWSTAATSSSITTLTAKETYPQVLIGAAQGGADIAAGSTVARSVTTTTSAVTLAGFTTTDTADVGTIHYLNFAVRGASGMIIPENTLGGALYDLKCRQGEMRLIAGRVAESSGTYSISYGANDFTITDNGTGDVTVTLKHGFHSNPCVLVECDEVDRFAVISGVTENSFTVSIENSGASAADAPFHFLVAGFMGPDYFHDGSGKLVVANGRKPRLFGLKLSSQTALAVGSTLATSASGGTGIFDVTFTQPFLQAPFVFALAQDTAGDGYWTAVETAATTSTVSIDVADEGGTSVTPDTLELLVLGFDNADVF